MADKGKRSLRMKKFAMVENQLKAHQKLEYYELYYGKYSTEKVNSLPQVHYIILWMHYKMAIF